MLSLHHRARRKRARGLLLLCAIACMLGVVRAQTSTTASATTTTAASASASASTSSAAPSLSSASASSAHSSLSHSSSVSHAPAPTATVSLSGLPVTYTLPVLNASFPYFILDLPTVSSLYITLNLCALGTNTSLLPSVLVSAAATGAAASTASSSSSPYALGTRTSADAGSGGVGTANRKSRAGSTWLLEWDAGFANWTWTGAESVDASVLVGLNVAADGTVGGAGDGDGSVAVQFSAATTGPLFALEAAYPWLGDTTGSSALLFSPLLVPAPQPEPAYPNYTLPGAVLSPPAFPAGNATIFGAGAQNLSLVLVPTGGAAGLENSYCAVMAANASAGVDTAAGAASDGPVWAAVGGAQGFRQWWVVDGLNATANYTAWVVDPAAQAMSAPAWLATKEDSFPCPLVLPTDICPAVGYAAAVDGASPLAALPAAVASNLTAYLDAFSTSLLTQACGRDFYSHVSSCLDCYGAYRDWLCRVLVPQCASASSSSSGSSASSTSSTSSAASPPAPSTAARDPADARNAGLPAASYAYTELLPCLGACSAADRACPISLGFRCPLRAQRAADSYAFVGNDSAVGDGTDGSPAAADQWGNRWCNG